MTLSRRCTLALAALSTVCLAASSTGCGRNVVQFPLESSASTVATHASTVLAGNVPASDYEIEFEAFSLLKDADNVVDSQSGYAQLVTGSTTGQAYAIHRGRLSIASTLGEVEEAFDGAKTMGALSALTTLRLPAAWFELVGELLDTTVERTVIIRNTDQSVSSYQLIVVGFD